jgi:hypothetical protein
MRLDPLARLIYNTIPEVHQGLGEDIYLRQSYEEVMPDVFSVFPISPQLKEYFQQCEKILEEIRSNLSSKEYSLIEEEWIQQKFAEAWLKARTQIQNWDLVIDYTRRLARRTVENQSLSKTLVIEKGQAGNSSVSMLSQEFSKVVDWLASSQFTFLKVNERLQILSYHAISLSEVKELSSYRFYPDFLHPVLSTLTGQNSTLVHLTQQGDLVIANQDGIIASKRKDRWTIYDPDHIVQSLAKVLNEKIGQDIRTEDPVCVACSLFQILFDMSFRRHGGLLIIDRPDNVKLYVAGGIERNEGGPLSSIFPHSPFNGLQYSIPETRKLVELSLVDGALILDPRGNLVQLGARIRSHNETPESFGMRDMAAYSAARYGATAFKVSADGEISVFFTLSETGTHRVHRLDFL